MRDELIAVKLGEYLQQKRKQQGLSQGDVSKSLGYTSPQFISNIERGLCSPPFNVLKEMTGLYKINAEEITSLLIRLQTEFLAKEFPIGRKVSKRSSGIKRRHG